MFIESKTWNGLGAEEMAEVYARIEPTNYKSPVAPPKLTRKKTESGRRQGTVKLYQTARGYGFIQASNGEEFFFHISNAADPGLTFLMRDERVTFEVGTDKKGRPVAVKISLIGGTH